MPTVKVTSDLPIQVNGRANESSFVAEKHRNALPISLLPYFNVQWRTHDVIYVLLGVFTPEFFWARARFSGFSGFQGFRFSNFAVNAPEGKFLFAA